MNLLKRKDTINLVPGTYVTLNHGIILINGKYDSIRDRYPVIYCDITEDGVVVETSEEGYLTSYDLIGGKI